MSRAVRTPRSRSGASGAELEDAEVILALTSLQRAIFKYPMAVQAAFSALVAEGREFSKTKAGAEWKQKLAAAQASGKARMVWEVLSMGAFTERYDGPLPSVFVDTLVRSLRTKHLEPLLSRLFE